jgi:hypothetical protein
VSSFRQSSVFADVGGEQATRRVTLRGATVHLHASSARYRSDGSACIRINSGNHVGTRWVTDGGTICGDGGAADPIYPTDTAHRSSEAGQRSRQGESTDGDDSPRRVRAKGSIHAASVVPSVSHVSSSTSLLDAHEASSEYEGPSDGRMPTGTVHREGYVGSRLDYTREDGG